MWNCPPLSFQKLSHLHRLLTPLPNLVDFFFLFILSIPEKCVLKYPTMIVDCLFLFMSINFIICFKVMLLFGTGYHV